MSRVRSEESGLGPSRRIRLSILATDFMLLVAATLVGFASRFSIAEINTDLVGPIQWLGTLIPIMWIVVLALVGAYDVRVIGLGLTEYGRIVKSALWVVAIVGVLSFLGKFDTSRAYVLITVPIGLVLLLIAHWLWRRWILHRRRHGAFLQPTVVVGDESDRMRIQEAFEERPWAGYQVVGGVGTTSAESSSHSNPTFELDAILREVARTNASCIALSASSGLSGVGVRELSWRIEGRGIDLLIASSLGAVAGPRMTMRVATGLPFLHLDEVTLTLAQRIQKRALDVLGAASALIILSPVFVVIAVVVAVSSGLPVTFRQQRVGLEGLVFSMWKFRTMVNGADAQRDELRNESDASGPTLKISNDPRITPIGRFLRRWSLDELPQLVNVLGGSMSLVGPRPHPLDDVERYRDGDARRLLAKPGMTGLWQVAGRSDLSWTDALELDLLYIENWSILSDLAILARTVQTVIGGRGAY